MPTRKTPPSAATRLSNIEEALAELGEIVANLPSEGEAQRLRKMQRSIRRITLMLVVPFVASTLFIVAGTVQWREARQATQNNKAGITCLLGQLFEHRVTNQDVHDRMAQALNVDPTPATPLPPRFSAEALTAACRPFFPRQ